MNEIWKDIKGHEGLYQVSNEGNVRSIDREVKTQKGSRHYKGKLLKPLKDKQGYLSVILGKHSRRYLVNRLVYESFNGEIPEGMQVNHKDEKKENNKVDNLNLLTPKENSNWGTSKERNSIKKGFQTYQYSLDGELLFVYNSVKRASELTGFSKKSILRHCLNNKPYKGYRWSYIPL